MDSQDNCHSWSDYEEKHVGFNICKQFKMALYSMINPKATKKENFFH